MRGNTLTSVILFAAACSAAVFLGLRLSGHPFTWHFGVLLGYFALVTLLLLLWQEPRAASDIKGFIRRFMGGLVLKLLGSLVLLFALVKLAPLELLRPLTITFALLYFAFLTFSTLRLTRRVRSSQGSS